MNDPRAPMPGDEPAALADLERRRKALAGFFQSVYRLVKGSALHADGNRALQALAVAVADAVVEVADATGTEAATLLFTGEMAIVNRQLLRTTRESHALVRDLGAQLERCGVTELTIERGAPAASLTRLGRAVSDGQRDPSGAQALLENLLPGVRARHVKPSTASVRLSRETPIAALVRTYAMGLWVVRSLLTGGATLTPEIGHRLKRVAQKLAAHADSEPRLLAALATAAAPPEDDPAALALATAGVSLAMAKKLGADPATLTTVAMACLLVDAGKARLAVSATPGEVDEREAGSAALVCVELGRLHLQGLARTAVVVEALALVRAAREGRGFSAVPAEPGAHALLVAVARTFQELRRAGSRRAPVSVADAIDVMRARSQSELDSFYVGLLVQALGVFPTGTLVELSTGELAVIVAAPEMPLDVARPPVEILADAAGELYEPALSLDLAAPRRPGAPARFVRRAIRLEGDDAGSLRSLLAR